MHEIATFAENAPRSRRSEIRQRRRSAIVAQAEETPDERLRDRAPDEAHRVVERGVFVDDALEVVAKEVARFVPSAHVRLREPGCRGAAAMAPQRLLEADIEVEHVVVARML